MKIYVVIIDISYKFDNNIFVEVFEDRKKAEEFMLNTFKDEVNDTQYSIVEINEDICTAYDEGYFVENHCEIKIIDKILK